jgi:pre-60S factor REI1
MQCNACAVPITTVSDRESHYKSDWHRFNVKRKCNGLPRVALGDFQTAVDALIKPMNLTFRCELCNMTFKSLATYEQHLLTKKHLKKASKRAWAIAHGEKKDGNTAAKDEGKLAEDAVPLEGEQAPLDGKEAKEEGEEEEDDDGEQPDINFDDAIMPKQCLFCSHPPFPTVAECLNHMLKEHSLFIPMAHRISDLEGLCAYLGAKVGAGRVCLYCEHQFKSVQAVRNHMIDKGHCKFELGVDDEVDSFYEGVLDDNEWEGSQMVSYTYADGEEETDEKQIEGSKPSTALATTAQRAGRQLALFNRPERKRHLAGINEYDELVLTDGTIIGHRYSVGPKRVGLNTRNTALVSSNYAKRQAALQSFRGWKPRDPSKYSQINKKTYNRQMNYQLRVQMRANNNGRYEEISLC